MSVDALKDSKLDTIALQDLKGAKFSVPDYQRGYRWGKDEIEALISDIWECESDKKYCLQPLVVQHKDGVYDLIDGQQRLTTIKIITQLAKAERAKHVIEYEISYERRTGSKEFLDEIAVRERDWSNPDFYHMSEAKRHINDYSDKKEWDIEDIYRRIKEKAQFIWYCIDDNLNAIEMFQKLNVGKIPLTGAELIKAVLLTQENHYTNEEKHAWGMERLKPEIAKRQSSKAREWDYIEQSLANDDFWYFIADDEFKDRSPRIEIILDAVAKDISGTDTAKSAFNIIYNYIKEKKNADRVRRVEDIWDMISAKHALFCEWFYDDELFHLIGFLVRANIMTVRSISQKTYNMRKSKTVKWLKSEIMSWEYLIKKDKNGKDTYKDTGDITYNDPKHFLRKFFLLFNILTILQTVGRDKNTKTIMRFPFEKYEKQKWDIEHIHAKADEDEKLDDEDENSIYNLALLDSSTNKEYRNASFIDKREHISQKIKTDRFVPPCTQNVFFKVYTSYAANTAGWSGNDVRKYQRLKKKWDRITKADTYKAETDKWNELDWFFYEKEIKTVVFEDFLSKAGADKDE